MKIWKKLAAGIMAGTMICTSIVISDVSAAEEPGDSLELGTGKYVYFDREVEQIPETLEVVLNLKTGVTGRQIIYGNYEQNQENRFSFELTADGKLRYYENVTDNAGGSGYELDVRSDERVTAGEKVQLTIVRDAENDEISLYQDGALMKNQKVSYDLKENADPGKPYFVGTDYRNTYFLQADISRIALWDTQRTADEIQSDMTAELTGAEENLSHCWNFTAEMTETLRVDDIAANGFGGNLFGYEKDYDKTGRDFSQGIERMDMQENLPEAPLTVEAWVKLPESSANSRAGVICGNYYQKYYRGIPLFNFEIYSNGHPRFYYVVDGQEYQYIASNVNVCTGKWTHVAMSYDTENKQISCYINGRFTGSQSADAAPAALNQPLSIGRDSRDQMNFKGEIADIRIWSTTRTGEQIRENFDKELTGGEEGLMAGYLLDEAEEERIFKDYSQNQNDAEPAWLEAELSEGDYTLAVIPDTQTLTSYYQDNLYRMMNWLVENQETYNIELALQMGDLVNSNGNQSEWDTISSAFRILDGKIPYVFVPGNHDTSVRDTSMFNKNFPYEKYSAEESFGGAFEEGKMDNTYSYFRFGNTEFMTIALEPAPRAEVIEWANQIAEENADKNIIVLTHAYMNYDGNRTNENSQDQPNYENNAYTGDEIWEEFASRHANIRLVLSGHVGFPDLVVREDTGIHGNKVQQVLCDAQFFDGETEGAAMVMLMTFKENSDEVEVNWYSTDRELCFRSRNQFTMTVERTTADTEINSEWNMEEGTGSTITDHTGTYTGTLSDGVTWSDGVRGTGLDFDGTGYVDLGIADAPENWTISAWVNRRESVEDNAVLIAGTQGDLKIDQWENTGTVGFTEYGVADYTFDYSVPIGEWVQLTFVSDARGTSLYVNGEYQETNEARINMPAVRIGANAIGGLGTLGYLNGTLDELKIYSRALSDEEIAALYVAPEEPVDPAGPVGKKTLEYFLNSAKEHVENGDTDDCVQSIKDLFTQAIAEGEAVMADENATREEVMSAAAKLMKAIQALDMKAGNKTDLEMAVELGDMIDLSKYVEAGQQEFTDALSAAKEVLADGDAMQGDIDAAWNALVDAMGSLRLKADKDALEALLNEAAGLDLSQYTEESAAVFKNALASAQAVFADGTLTEDDQQAVDDAAAALKQAKAGLAAKSEEPGAEEPSQTKNPADTGNNGTAGGSKTTSGSTNSTNANTVKAAKTGDAAQAAYLWVMVIAAGAIALAAAQRRHRR